MKTLHPISLIVAAVAMLAFSMPGPAFSKEMNSQKEGHGRMMGMDKSDDMMEMCQENLEKLGLTEDQTTDIEPLHIEMQKKQAQFKADYKIAKIDFMKIMETKDFDLDKASAAAKNIAEIKTAHELDKLKTMKKIRNILTDEQFNKMDKMMMSTNVDK